MTGVVKTPAVSDAAPVLTGEFASEFQEMGAIAPPCLPEQSARSATITNLAVEIPKSRSWITNLYSAEIDPALSIRDEYKKSFAAFITAEYSDGTSCKYGASVRISGDWKDHLRESPQGILSSLDVKLDEGNLGGVVRFKLLLPETRNGDAEIFATALYREMGFVAPRTSYVTASVNGISATYLFQESAAKEMLEYNDIRESALYEGDESSVWAARADNVPETDAYWLAFPRMTNSKWAGLSPIHESIAWRGMEILSHAYSAFYDHDQLLSSLLSNDQPQLATRLDAFALLSYSSGAMHALYPHNRRFYYDPLTNGIQPIYYDGDSGLLSQEWLDATFVPTDNLSTGFAGAPPEAYKYLEAALARVDVPAVVKELAASGVSVSEAQVRENLEQVQENADWLQQRQARIMTPEFSPAPLADSTQSIELAFGVQPDELVRCNLAGDSCSDLALDAAEFALFVEGRLLDPVSGARIVYGGASADDYAAGVDTGFVDAPLYHETPLGSEGTLRDYGDATVTVDAEAKVVHAELKTADDRLVVVGADLSDWTFEVDGRDMPESTSGVRINNSLLTGCLTLVDTVLSNVSIDTVGGTCEDSVNFIRATGTLASVTIAAPAEDGFDADFSHLVVERAVIKDTGNDCADLSAGSYEFVRAMLTSCGDKGASIGEKAQAVFETLTVTSLDLGMAVKDSSTLTVRAGKAVDVPTCAMAYRKKQEFDGGLLDLGTFDCGSGAVMVQAGSYLEPRT